MTEERLKEILLYFAIHYPAYTMDEKRMKVEAMRYCGFKREKVIKIRKS